MIFMIRQAEPFNKIEDATKGVGGAKFDFNKTFRNNYFHMFGYYYIINTRLQITLKVLLKKDKGQTIIYELILPI